MYAPVDLDLVDLDLRRCRSRCTTTHVGSYYQLVHVVQYTAVHVDLLGTYYILILILTLKLGCRVTGLKSTFLMTEHPGFRVLCLHM